MDRYKKILRFFSQNHHAEFDYGVIGINPESGKFFIKTSLTSDLIKKPVYSIKLPVRKICFLSLWSDIEGRI